MNEQMFFRGHLDLPILGDFIQPAKSVRDFRSLIQYQANHSNISQLEKYREEIEQDPEIIAMDGAPLPWGRFSVHDLGLWFIWRVNEKGIRKARSEIRRLKKERTIAGVYIAPIVGFSTNTTITLFNGYKIEPLELLPNFDGKIQFSSGMFTPGIRVDQKSSNYRSSSGGPIQYGYNGKCAMAYSVRHVLGSEPTSNWNDIANDMRAISLLATSLRDTRISLDRMVFNSIDSSPFGQLASGSTESLFGEAEKYNDNLFTENYMLDVKSLRKLFNYTEQNTIPQYIVDALYYLSQAKFKSSDVEAYMYLGMALEIALAKEISKDNRDSISSTIKRRGAWLLRNNYDDRKSVFHDIGTIYSLRSAAVHTGGFDAKKKKLANRVEHQNLCGELLLKLMLSGDIDLERLSLGG